jgi:hypothetical protein
MPTAPIAPLTSLPRPHGPRNGDTPAVVARREGGVRAFGRCAGFRAGNAVRGGRIAFTGRSSLRGGTGTDTREMDPMWAGPGGRV